MANMLALTCRPGENPIIELPTGEQIDITALEVKGKQVRISTDAPAEFSIVRVELRAGPLEGLPSQA